MYITLFSCVIAAHTVLTPAESYESTNDKRALSSFDTLGGIGLGKRAQISSFDSLGGLGLGKRAFNPFYRVGRYGLGKRTEEASKKALSSFDTLGGIGLGKRYDKAAEEKKSVSSFDTLAGIGLGKRARPFPTHVLLPYRAYLEDRNLLGDQEWKRPSVI